MKVREILSMIPEFEEITIFYEVDCVGHRLCEKPRIMMEKEERSVEKEQMLDKEVFQIRGYLDIRESCCYYHSISPGIQIWIQGNEWTEEDEEKWRKCYGKE